MILNLERGSMATVDLRDESCLVQCESGRLWITVTGDPKDYFMDGCGERLVSGPGRMVIEALERSCLGIYAESSLRVTINEDYCPSAGRRVVVRTPTALVRTPTLPIRTPSVSEGMIVRA